MMKTTLRFGPIVMIVLMVFASSCGSDDPVPCTELTWYQDLDGDGLGNPAISQDACEQPDGFVADNSDPSDACDTALITVYADADGDGLGDPDSSQDGVCSDNIPDGFVTNSDDVGDCFATCQDLGEDSELGLFFGGFVNRTDADGNLLWEPETLEDGTIVPGITDNAQGSFDDNATLSGGADFGVTGPVEGDHYISLISLAGDMERGQNRFSLQPCRLTGTCSTEGGPTVDLSSYTDPYLNVWINTGTGATDSAGIGEIQFRIYDDATQASNTFWNWDPTGGGFEVEDLKVNTGGEWRVYSFQLYSDVYEVDDVLNQNINASSGLIQSIRFSFNTERAVDATTNYVLNMDALSITEGPLVDVRYPDGYPE